MKKKNKSQFYIYLLIFLTVILHLVSLNFYPTNFEGGYGEYADFFNTKNKLIYLESYYINQFNTYLFSGFASILNKLVPIIDGFQSVKILSALGYIFLGLGIVNILKFYDYKNNYFIFILIIFLNSIIWSYGHRSFNDLFAFSLAIFFFSRILVNYPKKILYLDALLLGVAAAIKSYNLIFLFPLILFLYFKKIENKNIFKIFLITFTIVFPFILINILTFKYLGFFLAPKNEDLQIAIIGQDENRNIFWVLNNFIFYIGYLTLISFPFILKFLFEIYKNQKNIMIYFAFFLVCSFLASDFFFISSELNLGPLQKYIRDDLYKSLIIFCFFSFIFLITTFKKYKFINKEKYNIFLTIIISIILYLFILSFIKAAQRYLILPIPFFLLILFNVAQPRMAIFFMLIIYIFFNSFLLINYYFTGVSYNQIMKYLNKENIIEHTNPGVITPHVYHLYNNCNNIKNIEKCSNYFENKIKLVSTKYRVSYYKDDAIYSSKVIFLGLKLRKFSLIKN